MNGSENLRRNNHHRANATSSKGEIYPEKDDYWDEEGAVDAAAVWLADELDVRGVFQGDRLAGERVKNAEARKATKRLAAFLDPDEGRDVVDDCLELRERLAGLALASGVPLAGGTSIGSPSTPSSTAPRARRGCGSKSPR